MTGSGHHGAWFVVLPDSDGGAAAAAPLLAAARRVLRHASGRPWIVGSWEADETTVVAAGTARMAVLGWSGATADALTAALGATTRIADVDRIAATLTGCCHLVVSLAGQVRVQGSIAQVRRVFHARLRGVDVAADRADVLAHQLGARVDEALLAARLTFPLPPPHVAARAMWRGVSTLPGDRYLRMDADGSSRTVLWWRPPTPELPLADGAAQVREALRAAVGARTPTPTPTPLSIDLSGGLDSTSLCFLAAEHGAPLATFREEACDPGNPDTRWAELAAARLPGARHRVVPPRDMPGKYAGIAEPPGDPEEPFPWVRSRADLLDTAHRVAATGARLHLGGHGGDEVFAVPTSYLHTLVRRRPLEAWRHLRSRRAVRRWRLGPLLRSLADRQDYRGWLRCAADELDGPPQGPDVACMTWGAPARMAPWATAHTRELARAVLRDVPADVAPLAPLRAQHQNLEYAAVCGRAVRQVSRLFEAAGSRLEAPYLDDRVLEAALAVSQAERAEPRRYKPLLAEAMRGVVPAPILTRTTKGEFSAETLAGLRRRRSDLLALTEDSLLVQRGLVDAAVLRRAILATHPSTAPLWHLDMTLAAETWLRAHTSARSAFAGLAHRPPPAARTEETSCR